MNKQINTALAIAAIIIITVVMSGIIYFDNVGRNQASNMPVKKEVGINTVKNKPTVNNSEKIKFDQNYSKDSNNVYYMYSHGEKSTLVGADSLTFEQINEFWAKDKNSIYNNGRKIDGVDMQTFQIINNSVFAKDKNNVYFPNYIDKGEVKFDAQTFEILSGTYLRDKNQIVSLFKAGGASELIQITQVDIDTFQAVGGAFGKDKNHVYYDNKIINGADLETFKSTGNTMETSGNGQDKNNSYECSQSDVCGSGCINTNLKTKKKTNDYFGTKPQNQDPICNL
jgi:hypothetical protein